MPLTDFLMTTVPGSIAVVPIFVNAGAAILPAVIAALASAAGLLLKPRELARACRRQPRVAAGTLAGLLIVVAVGAALFAASGPAGGGRGRGAPTKPAVDWAKLAVEILHRRQARPAALDGSADRQHGAIVLGRDFSRCGYGGGPVPLRLGPLWQYTEADTMFLSSPAVAGGKVYAAACQIDVAGKYGFIVCLDAETGQAAWQQWGGEDEGFQAFFSSPALTADGKYLLIGQGLHEHKDCSLLCLDAATGKIRWQVKTPLHIEGSPAVRGDVVVAGAGAIEDRNRRPIGEAGFVLAVRISDGQVLWRHALADPESSPALGDDGTVYIGSGFNGCAVVALRGEPDEALRKKHLARELWRTESPYPVTGAVTLAGDLVVVGGGNGDYVYGSADPAGVAIALDRRTGKVRWRTDMPDAVLGAIAASGGKLICPVRNGEVVALSAADGAVLWRRQVSGGEPVLAACAFAGPAVYAVSRDGCLAVLRAADGKVLERHALNVAGKPGEMGLSLSSPTVVGGRLFVGSETGGLRCFVGRGLQARTTGLGASTRADE